MHKWDIFEVSLGWPRTWVRAEGALQRKHRWQPAAQRTCAPSGGGGSACRGAKISSCAQNSTQKARSCGCVRLRRRVVPRALKVARAQGDRRLVARGLFGERAMALELLSAR
tara:strand:+ start:860 stop:1195 length:336 start_codon:yes stop_codon:yes gene_type:complete